MAKKQPDLDNDDLQVGDNRKVVVEDLIFIDDLEIIIYTTVQPKTSQVFITNLRKDPKLEQNLDDDENKVKVVHLKDLNKLTD